MDVTLIGRRFLEHVEITRSLVEKQLIRVMAAVVKAKSGRQYIHGVLWILELRADHVVELVRLHVHDL